MCLDLKLTSPLKTPVQMAGAKWVMDAVYLFGLYLTLFGMDRIYAHP